MPARTPARDKPAASLLGVLEASWRHVRTAHLLALAVASVLCWSPLQARAADDDLFQQAVNYVFTGRIDPPEAPEIVDRKSCIVVMRDPKYKRYIRYYLSRFRMDGANFSKTYAGSRVLYNLEIEGDNVLIEYLSADKATVLQGYKSAQIALPGNIEQTQKALNIIFRDYCKTDQQKSPF
jgi:hypothetical protein